MEIAANPRYPKLESLSVGHATRPLIIVRLLRSCHACFLARTTPPPRRRQLVVIGGFTFPLLRFFSAIDLSPAQTFIILADFLLSFSIPGSACFSPSLVLLDLLASAFFSLRASIYDFNAQGKTSSGFVCSDEGAEGGFCESGGLRRFGGSFLCLCHPRLIIHVF